MVNDKVDHDDASVRSLSLGSMPQHLLLAVGLAKFMLGKKSFLPLVRVNELCDITVVRTT